ncbi:NAD(P)H-hydrate epimerase, partial [Escherichia coli]|nr:NAD(P)H-hydrate epimerase [Escherichia coli]
MIPVFSVAQVRTVEKAEISRRGSEELMKQAAAAVSDAAVQLLHREPGKNIVGLIGPGNNGGDGLYALANLARQGHNA